MWCRRDFHRGDCRLLLLLVGPARALRGVFRLADAIALCGVGFGACQAVVESCTPSWRTSRKEHGRQSAAEARRGGWGHFPKKQRPLSYTYICCGRGRCFLERCPATYLNVASALLATLVGRPSDILLALREGVRVCALPQPEECRIRNN